MVAFKEGRGGAIFLTADQPAGADAPARLVSRTRAMPAKFLHTHTHSSHTGPPKLTLQPHIVIFWEKILQSQKMKFYG